MTVVLSFVFFLPANFLNELYNINTNKYADKNEKIDDDEKGERWRKRTNNNNNYNNYNNSTRRKVFRDHKRVRNKSFDKNDDVSVYALNDETTSNASTLNDRPRSLDYNNDNGDDYYYYADYDSSDFVPLTSASVVPLVVSFVLAASLSLNLILQFS